MPSTPPDPVEVGIGLGGNVGDPVRSIQTAIETLQKRNVVAIRAISSLYRTAPWGGVEQPDYANACAIGTTQLAPSDLLDAIKTIERDLGRVETMRWGPRVIDIDILFYGDASLEDERLTLPHKELLRRAFVLTPLAEIAPERMISGLRVIDAARLIGDEGVRKWEAD